MEEIRIEVDRELFEKAKTVLASLGISIEDATAKFFEHLAADKERILKDFRFGIPAEELVDRAAAETIDMIIKQSRS